MDKSRIKSGYYDIETEQAEQIEKNNKPSLFRKYFVGIIIISLLLLFSFAVLIPSIAVTIHAGEKGVLYKRWFGKEGVVLEKVYPEGLYLVLPWNKMTRYNTRIQEVKNSITVLSKQGMKIDIKLSIRYRPSLDLLAHLHQRVGPNYTKTIVIPEVEGIVLSLFAKEDLIEIYTDIYKLIEKANIQAEKDLKENHIVLDELIVKQIDFPEAVRNAIDEKIKQKQIALGYEYKLDAELQEAKRKKIEAGGIQSFQNIVSEGISENYLKWKGIDATLKLANSTNSKVIVIGSSKNGLPIILNTDSDNTKKGN